MSPFLSRKKSENRLGNRRLRLAAAHVVGGISFVPLLIFVSRTREDSAKTTVTDGREVPRLVPHHEPFDQVSFWFSDKQATENAVSVQEKRQLFEQTSCKATDGTAVIDLYTPPVRHAEGTSTANKIKPCMFTFLDFGANVGDSLGKLIDAGLSANNCTLRYRYDVGEGKITRTISTTSPENKLTTWTREMMGKFYATHTGRKGKELRRAVAQPENYCYFGIEGNPVFTARLKLLQQRVLQSIPRPVRCAHIFTETVVSGAEDGPIILFLDTVNKKNNFFGSSLLPNHTDVRNSAVKGELVAAPVQGVTLSNFLKQTVKHQAGAHVLIKIDIEGAEFAVLNEAYDSGALCDCVASGVRIDMRVEIHPKVHIPRVHVIDSCWIALLAAVTILHFSHNGLPLPQKTIGENADLDRFKHNVWRQLMDCGVNVGVVGNAG